MAPTRGIRPTRSGLERVRHELLTALHFGRLTPGDRAPSVRRLADQTGMNRKTVHRAYTRLADEGLLDLRPGSGTFIAEGASREADHANLGELLVAVNRSRAAAEGLGLSPEVFGSFLDIYLSGGLRGLPVTTVECNGEQLGLIAQEISTELGLAARPVLLSDFARRTRTAVEQSWAVVTTDCHRTEVEALAGDLGRPIFRVALDPAFPRRLVEQARHAPIVMIVQDRAFAPVFLRLLRQMSVAPELVDRFHIAEPAAALALLRNGRSNASVYVSPLLEERLASRIPAGATRLRGRWRLERGSMDRLHAGLALSLAGRRR